MFRLAGHFLIMPVILFIASVFDLITFSVLNINQKQIAAGKPTLLINSKMFSSIIRRPPLSLP
jgi:hypothetical protein